MMCGIYGQFNPGGEGDPALIERMAHCLDHRGPDGYGTYHSGPLAFGAGRLAIIDLAAGVQPIFSEDGRVAVVFNGEIYNYKAIRADLEALGHAFATQTDTEVIVHGYESWGLDVVARLRGMFAFCVWDEPNERLLLARDRQGEKPLYYARLGNEFLFASEIKALFEHPGLRRAVNPEAVAAYLALGYVPPPQTAFAGIEKLAPAEMMVVDRYGSHREPFWQPEIETDRSIPYPEAVRQVRAALTESVQMQMMSDVPIGAFLSGGVDSTAVVGLMSRISGQPVRSFTVGFDFPPGSKTDDKFNVDTRYAALAAEKMRTDHRAIIMRQDESLSELFPHLVYALDEPISQTAIFQTAYVAALARTSGVPVLLNGEAGDELFLGYAHYRMDRILARYLRIPGLLRQAVITPLLERAPARFDAARKLAQKSRHLDPARRYLEWMRVIDVDRVQALVGSGSGLSADGILSAALNPYLARPRARHFADKVAYTSLRLSVPENGNVRVDKMSMAMSVETRAPFEDHRLIELALRLPLEYKLRGGDFKAVLKDAVRDVVPDAVLTRPKWGFFAPASEWLRTALLPLVKTYLSPERVRAAGILCPEAVTQIVDDHLSKRSYELWPVWTLLTFQVWHALYIEQSLTLDHKITPEELVALAGRTVVGG